MNSVVAVHGLGGIRAQDAIWTCTQEGEATSWLTHFLPIHVHCSRIMNFDYLCKAIHEGISIHAIRGLATRLLDQLLDVFEPVSASTIQYTRCKVADELLC